MDPSVVVIRDRLRDIFPEIKIPPEIIGWHIRQSTTSDLSASIETICSTFAAEILSFGQVVDPMKNHQSNEASVASSSSSTTTTTVSVSAAAAASAATSDELQTLYDVFNAIPREHVKNVYDRLKNGSEATNPHWHEDVINELLVYSTPNSLPSKKRLQDAMETNDQQDEHEFVSEEYDRFLAVLPDIDPDYAFECYMNFLQTTSSHGDLNTLITSLIERGYTKIQDTLERTRNERLKENLRQPPFEIEDFLKTFPEPLVYFYDQTKNVTESYKNHAFIYLANAFSRVPNDHIRKVLVDNKHRFAPAMKQLKEEFSTYHYSRSNKRHISNNAHGENTHKRLNHRARASIAIPDVPDEIFYKDLCYTKHEDEIIEYLARKKELRDEQIRVATENGTLQTCDCCCDDQILDDDMVTCDNNHKFCQSCVRNYIENGFISNGECFFTCLNPICKHEYSTAIMRQLLAPILFSRLLIKIQQEELRLANIPNFEQCKYCTFGTIIDDPNERVFRCLNPECLKETCRACGEPNHIPLRCDEVEKKDELDMRTFIENRVSEAMIRVCYKCKQRFYKLEGCNKMTCACGASMCYVCREPIKGYDHFNNNQKCAANGDVVKMHQDEMFQAYEEAKKAYIERHPESRDLVLKYDPQQHLTGNKPTQTKMAKRGRYRR